MWEIYAYQNADSLFGVFNAAAAIHGASDYASALAAVAFCGFVAALIAYAFAPEKLQGWKWLGTVVLVFGLLIVPKVTVGIVDRTGGSAVKVVDNVPFGVAMLGSITSTIGHTLTGLFETAFQVIPGAGALPAELSYQRNGLMFGNRLVRESGNLVFQDPSFRTDLVNFIHNCTTYDLVDGTLDPAAFAASSDVWPLMGSPNPARFSTVSSPSGVDVATCPDVYLNLSNRLPAQVQRLQDRLAFQLNPTLPAAAAAAVIAAQVQQAYLKNNIADASASAADIVRQNAMLNALEDTTRIVGQKVNDPAAMVLAVGRAQAVAQMNASWLNYGKVAEQALPVFRNVVEAVSYALFPLLVLLLLLTSGRETMMAFKGYAAILIWIQLWPPLYAILNYMASIYAAYDLAAAADLGSGARGLALQTSSVVYSRAVSGEGVIGYLAISIPFIAWAALKRMENFGTALTGGLSGLQASITGATSASTMGNTTLGSVSMDQMQLAPNRSSAFMGHWQNDLSGNTFSSNALNGRTAVSLLRNQGFASRVVSMRVSSQDVQDASRQVDAARGEAIAANQERSTVLADVFSRGLAKLQASRSSKGTSSSSYEQLGETLNEMNQISRGVSDATGMSQSQVARIALDASGRVGKNIGIAGLQAGASLGKSYASGLSATEQKVLLSMTSEQVAVFRQFGDRATSDSSFVHSMSSDARDAQEMSARLASATSRTQRADASLSERTAFAERVTTAHERGDAVSLDIAQDPHNLRMFMRYAEQYGGDSASAQVLMSSELARQSIQPQRVFSDGSALPASFGAVADQHRREARSDGLNPDLVQRHQADLVRTRSQGETQLAPAMTTKPSTLKDELRDQAAGIRAVVAGEEVQFKEQADAGRTPDGTLKSEKSLVVRTADQVGQDLTASAERTARGLRRLLKRDDN
ncbi:conjugal transfer protein TraG N-terminal domain-containing protein [Pseudorhodoferax soli]|uniref:Conjugal transfer mating pair stabilization protein TraG n=1 Tax=Pseudorhodoferax soli TaxID=545864 RepID=A0A368XAV3_9BURK|nr:conjugal transfer protein TraG N-terminal domain-containing protein [Pseudorhodoferax soli]RCW65080.1 conjugal transfer mating pair stabilization protein TraG [Pseudorhodoferax soli]